MTVERDQGKVMGKLHGVLHESKNGMPNRRLKSDAENIASDLATEMKKEFGDSVEIEANGMKY